MARDGPKWGRELFFPTNPDLANILGDTDFDFENFYFWIFFWIPHFPDFQIPGPGLIHFVAIFLLPSVCFGPGWLPGIVSSAVVFIAVDAQPPGA